MIPVGRQAKAMKKGRDFGGFDERGPRSKEKRRSLKFASQVMPVTAAVGKTQVRWRGRMVKRERIGRRERSLYLPLGILEGMK